MTLVVESTGPLATVQDLGRRGWAHIGLGASGAADASAHRLANRLVGNPEAAATVEITMGGFRCRFTTAALVALTGAECPATVAMRQPTALPAGSTLRVETPSTGLRTYLAVRGGIDVAPVLGSRSTDTLSGVGGPPLRAGDVLPIGLDPGTRIPTEGAPPTPARDIVRVWPGPRVDWFAESAVRRLCDSRWIVTPHSDRVGVRLAGPVLERRRPGELPSEGLVTGAIQAPPDGQPVVMLADHPVTGGYPVVAVVEPDDVALIAQSRPGDALRFAWHRHGLRTQSQKCG